MSVINHRYVGEVLTELLVYQEGPMQEEYYQRIHCCQAA